MSTPFRLTAQAVLTDGALADITGRIALIPWESVPEDERRGWATHPDERVRLALLEVAGPLPNRFWLDQPELAAQMRDAARMDGLAWTPTLDRLHEAGLGGSGGASDFLALADWVSEVRSPRDLEPLLQFRSLGPARMVAQSARAWDLPLLVSLLARDPNGAVEVARNAALPGDLVAHLHAWALGRAEGAFRDADAYGDGSSRTALAALRDLAPRADPEAVRRDIDHALPAAGAGHALARTHLMRHPSLTGADLVALRRAWGRSADLPPRVTMESVGELLTHRASGPEVWPAIMAVDPGMTTAVVARLLSTRTMALPLLEYLAGTGQVDEADWGRLLNQGGASPRVVAAAHAAMATMGPAGRRGSSWPTDFLLKLAACPGAYALPDLRAVLLASRSLRVLHAVAKAGDAPAWTAAMQRLLRRDPEGALRRLRESPWTGTLHPTDFAPLLESPDAELRAGALVLVGSPRVRSEERAGPVRRRRV